MAKNQIKNPFGPEQVAITYNMNWDGGIYSGMLNKAGVPHGPGRRVGLETVYEGEFNNGQRTGFARQIERQRCYLGNFVNGWKTGLGYQISTSNKVKEGVFEKDKLVRAQVTNML